MDPKVGRGHLHGSRNCPLCFSDFRLIGPRRASSDEPPLVNRYAAFATIFQAANSTPRSAAATANRLSHGGSKTYVVAVIAIAVANTLRVAGFVAASTIWCACLRGKKRRAAQTFRWGGGTCRGRELPSASVCRGHGLQCCTEGLRKLAAERIPCQITHCILGQQTAGRARAWCAVIVSLYHLVRSNAAPARRVCGWIGGALPRLPLVVHNTHRCGDSRGQ